MKCRAWVLAAALLATASLALGAPRAMSADEARHLLVRTGFEPTPAEIEQWVGHPAQEAVASLVSGAKAARPLHPLDETQFAVALPRPAEMSPEERRAARREQLREGVDIKAWWMREMLETPTPLAERMTLFWHGHFATSQRKVIRAEAMWQQHKLLREQALGNFGTLLHGIARDPAMLVYLDGARSRKEAPNENFAREVMELFTLGEASQGGGYTEDDIREAARAFTGFGLDRETFGFRFRPALHDAGVKTVFGRSGRFDGDAVIDLMLEQPSAARFITAKLWKEFVSPKPDPGELERIAGDFRRSGYDIAVVLRELLLADAFWDGANRASLVKSPVELVVGAVREAGVRDAQPQALAVKCAQLGQNLLVPPNVKGWPGYTEWINATTLLGRKRFTGQLMRARGDMDGMATVGSRMADSAYQLK